MIEMTTPSKSRSPSRSRAPGETTTRTRTTAPSKAKAPGRAKTTGKAKAPGKAKTVSPRKTKASQRTTKRPARVSGEERMARLPVPVVTPRMRVIHVPAPGMPDVSGAGRSLAAHLPPREQLAYYGGLGVMAAVGMISWPVAAAIGVGIAVARHARGTANGAAEKSS